VVGEAARGVDWLRGPPEAVFEVVEKENIVEVHCPLLLAEEEVSTAANLQQKHLPVLKWSRLLSSIPNEALSSNELTTSGISNNSSSR